MSIDPSLTTLQQLKAIIRRDLKLPPDTPLADDASLIGGQMDFDSLDALLVLTSVEKTFGLKFEPGQHQHAMGTLASFASYIDTQIQNTSHPTTPTTSPAPSTSPSPAALAPASPPAAPLRNAPDEIASLPHQPPFRFVTRFTPILPGRSGMGQWQLTGDEPFFAGHFPGRPIVPGVLISESMAQVSGLALNNNNNNNNNNTHAQPMALVHVDVRFRLPVAPPATLIISTSLTSQNQGLFMFDVVARLASHVVAQGRITLGHLANTTHNNTNTLHHSSPAASSSSTHTQDQR